MTSLYQKVNFYIFFKFGLYAYATMLQWLLHRTLPADSLINLYNIIAVWCLHDHRSQNMFFNYEILTVVALHLFTCEM